MGAKSMEKKGAKKGARPKSLPAPSPDQIEKCVLDNAVWLCLEYGIDDGTVSVEFTDFHDFNDRYPQSMETRQWVIRNEDDNGGHIMCNDRLLSYTDNAAVCVGNGESVHSERIHVVIKTEWNELRLEMDLMNEHDWDTMYDVNGDAQRVCTMLSTDRLCVEFHADETTHQVQRVDRVF